MASCSDSGLNGSKHKNAMVSRTGVKLKQSLLKKGRDFLKGYFFTLLLVHFQLLYVMFHCLIFDFYLILFMTKT
jgi:hypothetical protein